MRPQVIHSELVPYLIKCFHRLFPVPSGAALSATSALSKEIEDFDAIMREAGLLIPSQSDEHEAKSMVEKSADVLEHRHQNADAFGTDAVDLFASTS